MSHTNRDRPLISVVIPAYNEAPNIKTFYAHLAAILKKLPSYEIIYINDGSTDTTGDCLAALAEQDRAIRVITFSRNFGKESATSAGLHHANGQSIIMIDADGQHPPELIPDFIQAWKEGAQVVTGVRASDSHENFVKHIGSKIFYKILNKISSSQTVPGSTDFRLIDRVVQQEFIRFTERDRMTRGLLDWIGFKEKLLYFHTKPRLAGDATYSISKLFKLAFNSFISLSMAPLYFSGYAGLIITPIAFCLGIFIVIEQLLMGDPMHLNITGTAMLGVMLLFFVGILLISQGLIALYISHIHTEAKNRPLYIIDENHSIGIKKDLT